jgi:hypothetical protein
MTNPDTDLDDCDNNTNVEQRARRRFLGAGAAATPFLLTLVSQPALGVTCFTPSRSLSRNTSLSQQGKYGDCTLAASPREYLTNASELGASAWPEDVPPTTAFHPLFTEGSVDGITKFTKVDNTTTVSMTFLEVLQVNATSVAAYMIAAYLNKSGGNLAVIPENVLTSSDILNMWSEYSIAQTFEPMAGIVWGEMQIKSYLTSNGIVGI